MSYNFQDVKWRIAHKAAVTPAELAALLQYDHAEMFDLMCINNPANVNHTLRHMIGIRTLPFAPDTKALLGQVNAMVMKNDSVDLQKVSDNFKYDLNADNFTTMPELIAELKQQFPNWF